MALNQIDDTTGLQAIELEALQLIEGKADRLLFSRAVRMVYDQPHFADKSKTKRFEHIAALFGRSVMWVSTWYALSHAVLEIQLQVCDNTLTTVIAVEIGRFPEDKQRDIAKKVESFLDVRELREYLVGVIPDVFIPKVRSGNQRLGRYGPGPRAKWVLDPKQRGAHVEEGVTRTFAGDLTQHRLVNQIDKALATATLALEPLMDIPGKALREALAHRPETRDRLLGSSREVASQLETLAGMLERMEALDGKQRRAI